MSFRKTAKMLLLLLLLLAVNVVQEKRKDISASNCFGSGMVQTHCCQQLRCSGKVQRHCCWQL